MAKKRLSNSRQIDANATNTARLLVESDNTVVWRDVRIDDFGIDALLEFFPNGEISGRYMPMQLKGTSKRVGLLSRPKGFISCKIKTTTLEYGRQDVLPVLIAYVSFADERIYYGILQRCLKERPDLKDWNGTGDKVTVHLPCEQFVNFNERHFGSKLWNLYKGYIGL